MAAFTLQLDDFIEDVNSWDDVVNGRTRRMGMKASGRRGSTGHVNMAEY